MTTLYTLVYAERPVKDDAAFSLKGPFICSSRDEAVAKVFDYVKGRILEGFSSFASDFTELFDFATHGINLFYFTADDDEPMTDDECHLLLNSLNPAQQAAVVDWFIEYISDETVEAFCQIAEHENSLMTDFADYMDKRISKDVEGGAALSEACDNNALMAAAVEFDELLAKGEVG